MSDILQLFKTDFFSGVLAIFKQTWKKILFSYLIYYVGMLIIGGVFTMIALMGSLDLSFFSEVIGNPNPSPEDSLFMIQQLSEMLTTPEFLIPFILLFIILLIMGSWNYYFAFVTTNSEILGENKSFKELLKQSISIEVFKLIGLSIVLNILVWGIFFIALSSVAISGLLAFILFFVACIACMRFTLVIPAFIIGNYDFSSSFAFSFHHINWKRALKYFGISFLMLLILMGVSLIIGLVAGIFSFIPVVGVVVQTAINIFFGAIMMAVMTAGFVGLFYRYQETNVADIDINESIDSLEN